MTIVVITNLRNGRTHKRQLEDLKDICTGNDYQEMCDDLREHGASTSRYHRVELADHNERS